MAQVAVSCVPFTCDECIGGSGVWCGAGALCMRVVPRSDWLRPGDADLCGTADAWSSTCAASPSALFDDPAYEAQSWVYDLINVVPAWEMGLTGQGVQIVINDDGLDITHPDLAARFTKDGSCIGDDVGNPFLDIHGKDVSHGTTCAAIALGSANNDCSMGIAPEAALAGCPVLAYHPHAPLGSRRPAGFYLPWEPTKYLTHGLDVNHISSNSWIIPFCEQRQAGLRMAASSCSFGDGDGSPCKAGQWLGLCATGWQWVGTSATGLTDCEGAIQSYCDGNSRWYIEEIDPECHNWWHLSKTCTPGDLSEPEVLALTNAVTTGRGGKGTIFVFASGNDVFSSTNFQPWLFTRFTIAVGAVGKQGHHASYSTAGAALLVCAPGGDHEYSVNHVVAQPGGTCGNAGVGTSFAAPVVSGVVALMLEANKELTWRDVQGVLVHTSKKTDPDDLSWATNGAGLWHSYKYGVYTWRAHMACTPHGTYSPRVDLPRHIPRAQASDSSTRTLR